MHLEAAPLVPPLFFVFVFPLPPTRFKSPGRTHTERLKKRSALLACGPGHGRSRRDCCCRPPPQALWPPFPFPSAPWGASKRACTASCTHLIRCVHDAQKRTPKQSNNQTSQYQYHICPYHTTSQKNQTSGKYHSNTGKCKALHAIQCYSWAK